MKNKSLKLTNQKAIETPNEKILGALVILVGLTQLNRKTATLNS